MALCVCMMQAETADPALHRSVPARSCAQHVCVCSSCAPGGCCSHPNDAVLWQHSMRCTMGGAPAAAVQLRPGCKAWLTQRSLCSCSLDKDSAFMMSRSSKKAAALPAPADVPAVVYREVEGGPNPFEDMINKSFSDGSVNV